MAFIATASLGQRGRRAHRSSAPAASSTGSRRSSPRSSWPSPATLPRLRRGPPRSGRRRFARACLRSSTSCTFRTASHTLPTRAGRAARRARPARVHVGRVRPPAVRAVLVGHHRASQGDRPRARGHARGALREPSSCGWDDKPGGRLMWFSTTAWMMWNAFFSALLTRASIVMTDGDPVWPDLSCNGRWRRRRSQRCIGPQSGLRGGLPQGRSASGAGVRPQQHPGGWHGRIAAARGRVHSTSTRSSDPTCCSSTAAAAPTSAPAWCPAASCSPSTRARSPARSRRRCESLRRRGARGRRASWRARRHPADAVDARPLLNDRRLRRSRIVTTATALSPSTKPPAF